MGVYARGNRLNIRFKGPDGEWTSAKTDYLVGQERQAERVFRQVVDRIAAGKEVSLGSGPVTVTSFAEKWIGDRRLVLADPKTEETRLRKYILPVIGAMRIEDAPPRHLADA